MQYRWVDVAVNDLIKVKKDECTGDEIAADIIKRAGLVFGGGE